MEKQLSLFPQPDISEVVRLKKKVNELVTAIAAIESRVDEHGSVDEDWLEHHCYEVLLVNEKEVI